MIRGCVRRVTICRKIAISYVVDRWVKLLSDFRYSFCSLPQWSQTLFPNNEKFYKAAMKAFLIPTATKHLSKFSAGFLLKDLLDRFSSKIQHSLQPDRKFYIYSTHDFNLFNLLISLNIFDVRTNLCSTGQRNNSN